MNRQGVHTRTTGPEPWSAPLWDSHCVHLRNILRGGLHSACRSGRVNSARYNNNK